jgi:hypothetical protein
VSDDMNMSGEGPNAPVGDVAPRPAAPIIKRGTISRNALLLVAGAILLATTVGLVLFAMSIGQPAPSTPGITTPGASTGTPGGTPSTVTSAALPPVAPIDDRDVFAPHNPFEPIDPVSIAVAPAPSEDGTHTGGTSSTLRLISITALSGGGYSAVVRLGSTEYTVQAGGTVGTSLWHVDEITATELLATYDPSDPDAVQTTFQISTK